MRVLFVDEEIPYPLNTGKRLRTFNLLTRLAKFHEITYVCQGEIPRDLPLISGVRFLTVPSHLLPQHGLRFLASLGANLLSPRPYVVNRHFSRAMQEQLKNCLARENFDLLHCEWTPYTEVLRPFLRDNPAVLATHNVEAQIWRRLFETEVNVFRKGYIWNQWRKMHAFEKTAVQLYDCVTAVSKPDAALMHEWYGLDAVTVVPNGVDEAYFFPATGQQTRYSMVFTGSMDWRPNQDAIRFFLEAIFPAIRRALPATTLTVVGRNPPSWLRKLANGVEGVEITGTVDDVRSYVARADLYVVPLRIGGGSRLKILEALAMQKPVLSTSVGAEGLGLRHGEHLLLADDPREFAESAIRMLLAPQEFATLARQGRDEVLAHHTWNAIAGLMDRVWWQAVKRCHDNDPFGEAVRKPS